MSAADETGILELSPFPMSYAAVKQYQRAGAEGVAQDANPSRLIRMLLEGVIERIELARGAIEHGDLPRKLAAISGAVSILESLRAALNHDAGGDLAAKMDALYEYATLRLVQANCDNDPAPLVEASRLLGELRAAWVALSAGA